MGNRAYEIIGAIIVVIIAILLVVIISGFISGFSQYSGVKGATQFAADVFILSIIGVGGYLLYQKGRGTSAVATNESSGNFSSHPVKPDVPSAPASFCIYCGKPLEFKNTEKCPYCGKILQDSQIPREIRSPVLTVVFSFLFTGWGHWYCGKNWEGLKFFGLYLIATIIFYVCLGMSYFNRSLLGISYVVLLLPLGVWIYTMYDAYRLAGRINRGEESFSQKSRLFWLPVALLIIVIILLFILVAIAAFVFGTGSYT